MSAQRTSESTRRWQEAAKWIAPLGSGLLHLIAAIVDALASN